MGVIPERILQRLPTGARAAFGAAWPATPGPVERLREHLAAHVATTDRALTSNPFVDGHLSRVVADRLGVALDEWNALDDDCRRILHAAIAYYALRADATDDLASVTGFEDDARVANVCLRALGRVDLEIDLD